MSISMSDISTTKMSSKGQVVIPEEIRGYMHLESGVKFIAMATNDSIIFKRITPISKNELNSLLKASHAMAKKYHFDDKEVADIVSEERKAKKRKLKHSRI